MRNSMEWADEASANIDNIGLTKSVKNATHDIFKEEEKPEIDIESILYPKQIELVTAIRKEFATGSTHVVAQAATGFGKSVVAGYIIASALKKGAKRVVFIVDSITLINQIIKTFEGMYGLDVGVIQGMNDRFDLDKQVQIATPQTLTRRFDATKNDYSSLYTNYDVDLIITDECHIQHKGIYESWEHWNCRSIGFTATPYAKGMGLHYDGYVKTDSMAKLIADGDLADYKYFSLQSIDTKGMNVNASGDYSEKQTSSAYMGDADLVGDIVQNWIDKGNDYQTIGFAPNIAACEFFAEEFRKAGIKSQAIHSKQLDDKADALIKSFEKEEITVLWSVAKLVKGFDVPKAKCLIDCQPTKSLMRHVQKGGRVLRVYMGMVALIFDHANNLDNCGFYEEIGIDELCTAKPDEESDADRKKKDSKGYDEKKELKCKSCGVVHKEWVHQCDNCGEDMPIEEKEQFVPAGLDLVVDSSVSLVEIDRAKLIDLNKHIRKRNRKTKTEDKKALFANMKAYTKDMGYKSGYAAWLYKSHFGVWPNKYKSVKANTNMTHEDTAEIKAILKEKKALEKLEGR